MKSKFLFTLIATCCVVLASCSIVFADGLIVIERPYYVTSTSSPWPQTEALPVKYHRVTVTINNGVATTSVDQVFKNDYDVDVEGTYMFPIPEDAAITNFSIYVDGKKLSGEILDKDKARQAYEDIVRRMKDPGLLEYAGRNMFRARVYPIPKHGEKRIELAYQQIIKYEDQLYTYVYPLDTERFSPKPLEEVVITTKITSNIPIKSVYSPSHEVATNIKELEADCSYEAKDVKPDKNFILHYSVSQKDLGLNLLTYRKANEDGYFLLFLSPGQLKNKVIDKDVVFVLDTSGSMKGKKIEQAKNALRYCVYSLSDTDRFNLITFAATTEYYKNNLVPAKKTNIDEAMQFIDRIQAEGGTNINEALVLALKNFRDSKRPRMIVFLTDGEPTVGTTDIKEILKGILAANINNTRIFVFGVGEDVNTHFLDKISEVNRGASDYVLPNENIETKVSSFFKKVSEPVMSDIKLDFAGIKTTQVYPAVLPDIFNGTQLIVIGRYQGQAAAKITLTGYVDGKEKEIVYQGNFPQQNPENDFILRLWAIRKIGYLMSEMRFKAENKELVDEIVRLSKEFGIVTPYTSFFVAEESRSASRSGQNMLYSRVSYQAWDSRGDLLREGLSHEASFGSDGNYLMMNSKGVYALNMAQHTTALQKSVNLNEVKSAGVKHEGEKTFYLRNDGWWVDAKYQEGGQVKEVKFMSPEYLLLIKGHPKLGKYFTVAKKVIVVFEGTTYRIIE